MINNKVLMSGAEYFDDYDPINAHMDDKVPVDRSRAVENHANIEAAFKFAGIEVVKVPAPVDCQDAVYTANWGLVTGNSVILSSLPNQRKNEEPYSKEILQKLGLTTITPPEGLHFSGQGDALVCGKYLFVGSNYRTSEEIWPFLEEQTGLQVIGLRTQPALSADGQPVINRLTGWPDSYFYDLDLALGIITPTLIVWCPEAFTPESRRKIEVIKDLEKIEVDYDEALKTSACNLVSTGQIVIMGPKSPKLKAELTKRGYEVLTPEASELMKGGGFIRCCSLTLT